MQDQIHRQNMDPSLIRCEVWNPYRFPIIFRLRETMLQYLIQNGRLTQPRIIELGPNQRIILTHQYWDLECNGIKDNAQIFLPMNLGNDIGKNRKWLPGPAEPGYLEIKKRIQIVNNG